MGGGSTVEDVVAAKSVRNLVRPQLGLEADPWELALVQRDLVWKQDRMIGLLDSLLAGYPIGSLLLCRVEQDTDARQLGTGQGQERRVAAGTPQLVDGQQRAYALLSIFTDHGHGRFFMSIGHEWDRSASYIQWRPGVDPSDNEDEASPDDDEPVPPEYIALSRWAELADEVCDTLSDAKLDELVAKLTNGYAVPTAKQERAAVLGRLQTLCRAWREPRIPVITATVKEPENILEMFIRVNRGGAQVSGNDLYFAAVKTFWHDPTVQEDATVTAKEALSAIEEASAGFLDTWGALSLVSRLALVGLGEGDIVPLKVDRLSRANKQYIIRALRAVSPVVAERIEPFTRVLRGQSELKQALRYVHRLLWEEVFAWVVTSNRAAVGWSAADVPAVETYLLGASLFSYPQVLGDPYRRDAMAVALAAGTAGEPFPTLRLVAAARERGEDLRRGRRSVLPSDALQELAKANSSLLIASAQGLDDEITGLEWDHILAQSWREKFRLPRGSGRRYRVEAACFDDPANFWQIDSSANESVQDIAPEAKFSSLEAWPADGRGRISPSRNSGLEEPHRLGFEEVGKLLESGDIDQGASRFEALIHARNEWLVERLLNWPGETPIRAFAPDVTVPPERIPPMSGELSQRLAVDQIRAELAASRAQARARRAAARADVEVLLGLAAPWTGQAGKLEWVVTEVTKKHAKISGAGLGWWISRDIERQTLSRSVPLLPLEAKDHFRLAVSGLGTGDGHTPFRILIKSDTPGFHVIRARLAASRDFELTERRDGLEIPIYVRPELDWNQMLSAVDSQVTRFRDIVEADDTPDTPPPPEA
jgi:hypothetical protein